MADGHNIQRGLMMHSPNRTNSANPMPCYRQGNSRSIEQPHLPQTTVAAALFVACAIRARADWWLLTGVAASAAVLLTAAAAYLGCLLFRLYAGCCCR